MAYQYIYIYIFACESPRSETHGYLRFKLPAFNALDKVIIHGRLDYVVSRVEIVTFENASFRVDCHQTLSIWGCFRTSRDKNKWGK